jgi:hypothetical protein
VVEAGEAARVTFVEVFDAGAFGKLGVFLRDTRDVF